MDPQELERRKQEARDEGYSEEEINAALGIAKPGAQPAAPAGGAYTPPPDQTIDRSAEQNTTMATGAAMGAAAIGLPAALAYAVKRGVSSGAQAMDVAKQGISAMQEQNAVARAHQQLQYDKLAARGGVPGPVAPAQPAVAPTAPAAPAVNPAQAAAAQEAQQISRANQIVRGLALDRLMKAGAGLGMATYSGGLNTNEDQELARRRAREVEQARQMGWIK